MQRWASSLWSLWVAAAAEVTQIISPSGPRFLSHSPSGANCFSPTPHSHLPFLPPSQIISPSSLLCSLVQGSSALPAPRSSHSSLISVPFIYSFIRFLASALPSCFLQTSVFCHVSSAHLPHCCSPFVFSRLENLMRRLVNLTCHLTQVKSTEVVFSQSIMLLIRKIQGWWQSTNHLVKRQKRKCWSYTKLKRKKKTIPIQVHSISVFSVRITTGARDDINCKSASQSLPRPWCLPDHPLKPLRSSDVFYSKILKCCFYVSLLIWKLLFLFFSFVSFLWAARSLSFLCLLPLHLNTLTCPCIHWKRNK